MRLDDACGRLSRSANIALSAVRSGNTNAHKTSQSCGLRQVLLSVLMASAGGGRATDATGERLRALLGTLAAAPAEDAPVLLAGLTGERRTERDMHVLSTAFYYGMHPQRACVPMTAS